ncbi:maleylpyruvate isomerase family mycothiol-dependent enzyme [Plantactinospora sp. ZYX-F-223]|uniref:maleylpyruvate isomerase family mycothiol-dependent enzyme n=1 Tax=Plantactinospora sp. ZYX-F-223 TaxID=3144103 RepID=UPI0031FC1D67
METERLRLCAFLEQLDPADWLVPSLCQGWTVHDLVAHLTIPTRATMPDVIIGAIRARGNFHRMTARQARDRAARFTPDELIAQLRETAGSDRRMPGSGPMDPLVDVLVHGQDIARPLRRPLPMPVTLAVAALDYVLDNRFTGAPKRVADLRLVAADADWATETGTAEVRGPAADLLLAAMGRPEGLSTVSGSGIDRLTERLRDGSAPGTSRGGR